MKHRLEISQQELHELSGMEFKVTRLKDAYLIRLLRLANKVGLEGKRMTEVYGIEEDFATGNLYIDFLTEQVGEPKEA